MSYEFSHRHDGPFGTDAAAGAGAGGSGGSSGGTSVTGYIDAIGGAATSILTGVFSTIGSVHTIRQGVRDTSAASAYGEENFLATASMERQQAALTREEDAARAEAQSAAYQQVASTDRQIAAERARTARQSAISEHAQRAAALAAEGGLPTWAWVVIGTVGVAAASWIIYRVAA